MKKCITLAASLLLLMTFNSCIKDTCSHVSSYTWFEPVYKTTAEVRANIKSGAPRDIKAPGKLFLIGNYIFLNEINKGIHIINNSNPAAPVNTAFIEIPGNIDVAVKGNTLYADLYTDLVTLDISNPLQVVTTSIVDHVFPHRYYGFTPDSTKVIYDWIRHDTTFTADCNNNQWGRPEALFMNTSDVAAFKSIAGGSPTGIAGSMARFALMNNYLYTVGQSQLKTLSIADPQKPVVANTVQLPWGIETIYPFKDRLFIGSNTGMYIFNTANPAAPVQLGTFSHARVCDPVIADDRHAFVTLRNGTTCQGFLNELNIVDITNLTQPVLVKKYDLTNPHGLSKDGDLLLICDGRDGLKIFDAKNVNQLILKKQLRIGNTYDVIAWNGLALVVTSDALVQLDYTNINQVKVLSKLSIAQ